MENCLAATGDSLWIIVSVAILAILAALAVLVHKPLRKRLGLMMVVFAALGAFSFAAPSYAAEPCVATAAPDTSTGAQGEVQVYNVVANDTPSEGASFILGSLTLALVDSPVEGSTVSADGKKVTVPGEGVYVALSSGKIQFTPEASFVGKAKGVRYSIKDTNGQTVQGTYTPTVTGSVAVVAPVAKDDQLEDYCGQTANPGAISSADFLFVGSQVNEFGAVDCDRNGHNFDGTTSFTTKLLANDPSKAVANPATVDLDPATPGVQQSITGQGFSAQYDPATDVLTVTVASDRDADGRQIYLSGVTCDTSNERTGPCESKDILTYTFKDTKGTLSNTATVSHKGIYIYVAP